MPAEPAAIYGDGSNLGQQVEEVAALFVGDKGAVLTSTPAPGNNGNCVNPFAQHPDQWGLARTDQGVDYIPLVPTPVEAICNGVITQEVTAGSIGWPGTYWITYRLTSGPFINKCIYVSEHLANPLPIGTNVVSGQTIATALPGSPYTEWGWAAGLGAPSVRYGGHADGSAMPGGQAFARFLRSLGAKTRDDPGAGDNYAGNSC